MAARDQSAIRSKKPVLTEQEKAVLLECRRNSIARGLPLGIAGALGLRLLVRLGGMPSFVTRHPVLFYIGTFGACFTAGVNSYKQTCIDKIMSLEDSFLANQVREHMKKQNLPVPDKWQEKESTRKQMAQPDNILDDKPGYRYKDFLSNEMKEPPTQSFEEQIISRREGRTFDQIREENRRKQTSKQTYVQSKDTAEDQPDAFGSMQQYSQNVQSSNDPKYGRSFEEIREENRRKQLNRNFPQNRDGYRQRHKRDEEVTELQEQHPSSSSGRGRAVKRNKYGDIIYEDD